MKRDDSAARVQINKESIIKAAVDGSDLPIMEMGDYSRDQIEKLVDRLIAMIQSLLLGEVGISDNFREAFDSLLFSAKKDSTTSSMRPSSDFGRKTKKNTEEGPGSGQPSEGRGQGKKAPEKKEDPEPGTTADGNTGADPEKEAEASLRADHNRSRRTPGGRHVGKAKGEAGFGFTIPKSVDREEMTVEVPDKCRNCARKDVCIAGAKHKRSYNVYDFELILVKRTTVTPVMECPEDGIGQKASPPEDASGVNQYGPNVRTLTVLLYTVGMVSLNRIRDMVAPMFGIKLSETTILNYVHLLAEKLRPVVDAVLEAEKEQKVSHCDETGCRVGTDMHWIHCVASEMYTFVTIHKKRGKEALDAIGFLTTYVGTVVHDCLAAYWCMDEENDGLTHAVCNGHIERELAGLSKFFHNASLWADDMLKLLQEMLHTKHELQKKGEECIGSEELDSFSRRFDALIERGKELHPLPQKKTGKRGKPKKGRARCLIERMELRKDDIFRFLTDFDVPYTNNCAERSFRLLAIRKSVGIFRNLDNAQDFCVIWSYLSTAKKHGHSYYTAIREAFAGNGYSLIFSNDKDCAKEQRTA